MTHHEDPDSIQIAPDPDKLDRYHRQQLSAMLDGELSPDQARFMLRRLQHDAELAGSWERWQVGGDVLRGQGNALLPADFAQKVSAAIAGDSQMPEARPRAGGPRLLRWGGGAALAASVAMAALLVGRQAGVEPEQVPLPAFPELAASGQAAASSSDHATEAPPSAASPGAEGAVALAGAALAATEAPPRAAERRERDQARNAVAARSADASDRAADAPRVAAGPSPDPGGAAPAVQPRALEAGAADTRVASLAAAREGIGADPFKALPKTVDSRPWPRATAGAGGSYSVGFGNAMAAAPAWPAGSAPQRRATAELFGLPVGAGGDELPAATAFGARAIGAGDAAPAPHALLPGPR